MKNSFESKYIKINEVPLYELANVLSGISFKILIILLLNVGEDNKSLTVDEVATICKTSHSSTITNIDKLNKVNIPNYNITTKLEDNVVCIYLSYTIKNTESVEKCRSSVTLGTVAKAVIDRFDEQYLNHYSKRYKFNFARDMKTLKDGVCQQFSLEEIYELLDIAFEYYDRRWKSPKFPVLTLGAFATWVYPQCNEILKNNKAMDYNQKEKLKAHEDLW